MTVEIRHLRTPHAAVSLISGVDTPAAVEHLCHSLVCGEGVDDPIVVVDLRTVRGTSLIEATAIREAQLELQHQHRWLGVVGTQRMERDSDLAVYPTVAEAVRAGLQYFRLVTGSRRGVDVVRTTVEAFLSAASAVPVAGGSLLRAIGRRLSVLC